MRTRENFRDLVWRTILGFGYLLGVSATPFLIPNSINVSVQSTCIIFGAIVGFFWFKDTVTPWFGFMIIVGIIGVILCDFDTTIDNEDYSYVVGVLICVVASILYAFYANLLRNLQSVFFVVISFQAYVWVLPLFILYFAIGSLVFNHSYFSHLTLTQYVQLLLVGSLNGFLNIMGTLLFQLDSAAPILLMIQVGNAYLLLWQAFFYDTNLWLGSVVGFVMLVGTNVVMSKKKLKEGREEKKKREEEDFRMVDDEKEVGRCMSDE